MPGDDDNDSDHLLSIAFESDSNLKLYMYFLFNPYKQKNNPMGWVPYCHFQFINVEIEAQRR